MSTLNSEELLLTATDIGELPWAPFDDHPGVWFKTLWRDADGRSFAGLIKMLPGASIAQHRHRSATHHVWVESGSCRIGERSFGPGAYLHVPAAVEHGIDEAGSRGCVLLYIYLPGSAV